jgi:hypothetical protein
MVRALTQRLPHELIRSILIIVFADSLHKLSVCPTSVTWEMNVIGTLSSVSFAFRKIILDVAARVVGLTPPQGSEW